MVVDHITLGELDALESPLIEEPLFPVQAPDGRKDLSELDRQAWFVAFMRRTQPHIEVHANPNAAKRGVKAQAQVRKEGLKAGVFDITVAWDYRESTIPDCAVSVAWPEFKGYDSRGRAGKLTPQQIAWGNAMHRKGFPVACFFSAKSVVEWLQAIGAPIRKATL